MRSRGKVFGFVCHRLSLSVVSKTDVGVTVSCMQYLYIEKQRKTILPLPLDVGYLAVMAINPVFIFAMPINLTHFRQLLGPCTCMYVMLMLDNFEALVCGVYMCLQALRLVPYAEEPH